ncbi:MAG: 50S ribosomal protein L30e [Candidatus Aenigmarchaeota archaeon]|nr:50S ribosomal protein L30e [Candidatus Aenigmarchaeota archaeon]
MTDKSVNDQIKDAIASNNAIIGTKRVLKIMKSGEVSSVVIAKNCPEIVKKDVMHYSKVGGIEVNEFNGTGKDLGTFCGKPFSIAILAINK